MSAAGPEQLEAALAELEAQVKRKKKVGHHHVRDVLLGLGTWVLAAEGGEPPELEPWLERVRAAVKPVQEAWDEAYRFELEMACTEHCQSVDLRYLNLPRYDFAYTVAARERLEARFRAAEALGWPVAEELLAKVQQADAVLEPFLRSRDGEEPLN